MDKAIEKIIVLGLLILLLPLFLIFFILVKLTSPGPFLYTQKRMGKDKKGFQIFKIRTMKLNSEKLKSELERLNEADGPVFKIRNDPRYTKIGKFLSHTGIDELPQLINIIKGEMSLVGPRPLPHQEAIKISKKYTKRFDIFPGITSSWVVNGNHKLSFDQWMELDIKDVSHRSIVYNLKILAATIILVVKNILKQLF